MKGKFIKVFRGLYGKISLLAQNRDKLIIKDKYIQIVNKTADKLDHVNI